MSPSSDSKIELKKGSLSDFKVFIQLLAFAKHSVFMQQTSRPIDLKSRD